MSDVVLSLVVLRVADLERSAAFYRILGLIFTKHRHGTGPEHYACDMSGTVFELYPRRDESDSTSRTRLGFKISNLDQTLVALEQAGAKIISPPKDSPFGRRAVVDDPDGHRVELSQ
jgi:catechol 2,3-dioxygenase-like lactoylglutathione lyase family enzyme